MDAQTWQAFFIKLSKFLLEYERSQETQADVDRISSVKDSAKHYRTTLTEICDLVSNSLPDVELRDDEMYIVRDMMSNLEALKLKLSNIIKEGADKEELLLRNCGGTVKSLDFNLEQMCFLRSIGLSWTKISTIFGISRMTLYLKRRDAGIVDDFKYSNILDSDLEKKIKEIKMHMPDIGEKMVTGVLRSNGIYVQRRRIRKAIHSIDPIKTALRWHEKVRRRIYSVPGPMSLWHIGKILKSVSNS